VPGKYVRRAMDEIEDWLGLLTPHRARQLRCGF